MPAPSFSFTNGQTKAVFRWADSIEKRNRIRLECYDEMRACQYKLLTPMNALLPFQFARPFSVLGITSWEVYNLDGTLELTYNSTDRGLLVIDSGEDFDTVTYNGGALSDSLASGFYYSKIVTAGQAYYSEDFYVMCAEEGDNQIPTDYVTLGLNSEVNPSGLFTITTWSRFLSGTKNTAGAPGGSGTDVGERVANFNDNLLYTWNGSSWDSSGPADATGWYDNETGNWYQTSGGAWSGMFADPLTIGGTGITWPGGLAIPVSLNVGDLVSCLGQSARIEVVTNLSGAGSVAVTLDGNPLYTNNGNETETSSATVTADDLLTLTPTTDFDGYVTAIRIYCQSSIDSCNMRLTWTNCGAVGNIGYGDLVQKYYLPVDTIRPRATTKLVTESEEDDQGNKVELFRRKEVEWRMFLGIVPWFVADALTEMCLHNTVKLVHPDQEEAGVLSSIARTDILINPKVEFARNDSFSKCLVPCTLTFELDNTSVACCDDLDAPCKTACTEAKDFVSNYGGTGANGDAFLNDDAPTYQLVLSNVLQTAVTCTTGHATILGVSYLWSINDGEWQVAGEFDTITPTVVGEGCTINIIATIAAGYSAILQYKDSDDAWQDDDQYDLTAEEWADNDIERETPEDEGDGKELRLKIYTGDCVLGYSDDTTYSCS